MQNYILKNEKGNLKGIKVDGLGKPDKNAEKKIKQKRNNEICDLEDSAIDKPKTETYEIKRN